MRKRWVKLWTQESLYGSITVELEPQERWAWIGLLLLAGDSIEPGKVCAAPNVPWTDEQLANILKIPKEIWLSAKGKMLKHEKIRQNNDGVLHIVNWEKYQGDFGRSEYMRQYMKKYRRAKRKTNSKTVNSKTPRGRGGTEEEEEEKKKESIKKEEKQSFHDYVSDKKKDFPDLDVDDELEQFNLYWSEQRRKPKSWKRAFLNWLKKAREMQNRRKPPEEDHEWV